MGIPRRFAAPVALRRALAIDRLLTLVGLASLVTLAGTLVGLVVDQRVITGAPAWLKPAKFAISISIYSFTLLWLLSFVRGRRRLVTLAAAGIASSLAVELAIIVVQVARGTTSHFNVGTPLDSALWGLMGFFIVLVWIMTLLVAILLLVQRLPDAALAWTLRLAVLLALVGTGLGFLMTQPTPQQQAAARASGRPITVAGAHAVGVADGGPGLPLVGWSTEGGDLRAAHFVGLHALQVLPFVGWLLARRRARRLGERRRVALAWTAGLSYLGLVLLLAWQALRGQSVVAPDATTLAAFAALAAATLAAVGIIARARAQSGSVALLRSDA